MVDLLDTMLYTVTPLQMVLVWLAVLLAAVLRAFTGFGFGLAAVPVFSLFMPPTQAVVLSACLTFSISLLSLKTYWGIYPVGKLRPMLLTALVGTFVGVYLLARLDTQYFQLLLGLAVIVTCVALSRYQPRQQQPGAATSAAVGLCSGVLNGAFAIPGPPVILYAMATQQDPRPQSVAFDYLFPVFGAVGAGVVLGLPASLPPPLSGCLRWRFPPSCSATDWDTCCFSDLPTGSIGVSPWGCYC